MERSSGFRQRRGSAGLVLMRGDGCEYLPDTNSASDWEVRTFRLGRLLFCAQDPLVAETTDGVWASIGPDGALGDLIGWIDGSEISCTYTCTNF